MINQPSAVSGIPIPTFPVVSNQASGQYGNIVFGPANATSSDIAEFNGTTGKLIKDGGLSHANVAGVITTVGALKTGYREGLQVTIKDATNLYMAGGVIEVNGTVLTSDTQVTIPTGTLSANSTYYLYIVSAGTTSISATAPVYDNAKYALYMTGDATKRWMSTLKTA
jgi:hypothetical protein